MKHFLRIGDLDPVPTLAALAVKPDLWNENDLRTTYPGSPHAAVDDVWLLFNRIPADASEVVDDVQVVSYRAWSELPNLRFQVLNLMHQVQGMALGRVLISRLAPGKRIEPHKDQGAPAELFSRYQIALQSLPGCSFRIEDETVQMPSGSVWWINNRAEHEVVNNSADDRIACIVDIRPC
jgi:hypothetical protein